VSNPFHGDSSIKKIPKQKRQKIYGKIKNAVRNLGLENNISFINLKISKVLHDNADVDYKNLKNGKISLIIGTELINHLSDQIIHHELFHVKDHLYSRISFGKNIKKESKLMRDLIGEIINLSIDGRLEKMNLPRISKHKRLKIMKNFLRKYYNKKFEEKELKKLFDKIWSKKFSSANEVVYWAKKYYEILKYSNVSFDKSFAF